MRFLSVACLLGVLLAPAAYAAPVPATLGLPSPWMIDLAQRAGIRVLEFVEWIEEDLRAQVERRRGADPPQVAPVPALEGVDSGGTSTAAPIARGAGMLP